MNPNRCGRLGLCAAMITALLATSCKPPNYPTGAIEQQFYANGTWAVTVQAGAACCDSAGNKFDLYYPTNLGAGGFKHPILTWGNGSFAVRKTTIKLCKAGGNEELPCNANSPILKDFVRASRR
jgi:hypothetical protein